jgi:xanthine dehydrogenase YagS FAD-binding subunit
MSAAPTPTPRAGGTDLMDRRRHGRHSGSLLDLLGVAPAVPVEITPWAPVLPAPAPATPAAGGPAGSAPVAAAPPAPPARMGLRIGAGVRIDALAHHPAVRAGFGGLAAAAGGLGTPQIRAQATVGGNLLQEVRCPYFREGLAAGHTPCLKAGGAACHARGGDHLFHACVDLGPCVAPHPSTLAAALLCWDAEVELDGDEVWPLARLLGAEADPRRTHALPAGRLLRAVRLPAAAPGDRSAYARAANRGRSEWPLVEACARLSVDPDGKVRAAAVALGGVANRPIRLPEVEAALVGRPLGAGLAEAAARADAAARPLPMTGYKRGLMVGCALDALERAAAAPPAPEQPA